ncbi:hypothetical protein GCM10023178_77730 [Actinomadura luteofluorescens]
MASDFERFFEAVLGGDLNRLLEVLAPDVALWSDGGGKVRAPRRAVFGAEKIARFLAAIEGQPYEGVDPADMRFRRVDLNGVPALVVDGPNGPISTVSADVDADGRVTAIHLVANPDKLRALAEGRRLTP